VIAVQILVFGTGRDAPDGGDLSIRVRAIHEVVVEGVASASALASPDEVSCAWVKEVCMAFGDGSGGREVLDLMD